MVRFFYTSNKPIMYFIKINLNIWLFPLVRTSAIFRIVLCTLLRISAILRIVSYFISARITLYQLYHQKQSHFEDMPSGQKIRKESRYRCSTCEVPLCMIKQLLFLFTLKNTTLKSVELVTSFFLNFSCLRITYFFNYELLIFYRMKMGCFLVLLYFLPKIYNSNICPVFDVYTRHCFILTIHPVRDVSN